MGRGLEEGFGGEAEVCGAYTSSYFFSFFIFFFIWFTYITRTQAGIAVHDRSDMKRKGEGEGEETKTRKMRGR